MLNEGTFHGDIDEDHDNGGHCQLTLEGGRFELRIVRYAPYSIEDGDTFRGVYRELDEALVLEAREHYSYHSETVVQERTIPVSHTLRAAFAGPNPADHAVLDLRVDIGWPFQALLLPEGHQAANNREVLEWTEAENARRHAARQDREARNHHARMAARAAEAFNARDYKRVIALLEPLGDRLSPAERKKLQYAREHLS